MQTLYSQSHPQGTKANPTPPEQRTQRLLRGAMVMTTPRRLRDLPQFDAFGDDAFWQDPYPALAEARRTDSVLYRSMVGPIALGFDSTKEIGKDPRFGVSSAKEALAGVGVGQPLIEAFDYSLLHINPPQHTERRSIIGRRFGASPMRDLEPRIEATVDSLLDALIESQEGDFLTAVAGPLATRTFCTLLDVPFSDEPLIEAWTRDMAIGLRLKRDESAAQRADLGSEQVLDYLGRLARDRLDTNGADALSIILRGFQEKGHESPAELAAATFAQVMMDGIETVKNALANGLHSLLLHPEAIEALLENPALIPAAVEEMLRFDGPTLLTGRKALEDMDFHGIRISAGTPVSLVWLAANRDETRFPDPDRFDLHRKSNRHLAFGVGIHSCAGANLARVQMRIFFDRFFKRIHRIERVGDEPKWLPFGIARGLQSLPIRVQAN
ncbi:MAG: cytochrome P450 [Proteobacteria bacterium TMED72]|nr:MAG: cytochrome P450 [Proteobacteria bacterium TMED72]